MARRGAAARRLRAATAWVVLGVLAALVPPVASHAGAQSPPPVQPVAVPADAETEPAVVAGDAVDDPAIWRDPVDPSRSLLIGNDKLGGLDVYDLEGTRLQRITTGTPFWGNVDVRQGVELGGRTVDVVAAYNEGLRLFTVDRDLRQLVPISNGAVPTGGGEGLCLHRSATDGATSAFVITIGGRVRQYVLADDDADGMLEAALRREFEVGSEAEGCVADDDTGALYVSEEDVGLWRYHADPASGAARTLVDAVAPAGRIAPDAEGVTLIDTGDGGGHVVVSAQNVVAPLESYFAAYSRETGGYTGAFRVTSGPTADGCSRTDGITALAADLGPAFPSGAFVCQDDANTAPGSAGNQDFKLVRLERVLAALAAAPPPPPSGTVEAVGAASSNGNRLVHRTTIPAGVQPGDTLLALFGANGTSAVTGPAGWELVAGVTDGVAGRVWRRTATAGDAGSDVTVTTAAYQRSDLSVLAYRGVDPAAPIVAAGTVEVRSGGGHTTPVVSAPATGLVVSYWAERSSDGTALALPPGQVLRTSSSGTGGGRITAAASDPAENQGPGTVGGVTATGTAQLVRSALFTVVLPAATGEPPPPPPSAVTFVAAASTNGNRDEHATTVPAGVRAGDRLLALFAANGSSAVTAPPGWTEIGSVGDSSALGRVWTRIATAADAGSPVVVRTAGRLKSDLSVVAYRDTDPSAAPAVAGALQVGGAAQHVAPLLDAPGPALVVSYWGEKSSSGTTLTPSGDLVVRTSSTGSGGGRVTAAVADAGATSAPGTVGGATMVGTSPSNRTVMFTVAVPAAGG